MGGFILIGGPVHDWATATSQLRADFYRGALIGAIATLVLGGAVAVTHARHPALAKIMLAAAVVGAGSAVAASQFPSHLRLAYFGFMAGAGLVAYIGLLIYLVTHRGTLGVRRNVRRQPD